MCHTQDMHRRPLTLGKRRGVGDRLLGEGRAVHRQQDALEHRAPFRANLARRIVSRHDAWLPVERQARRVGSPVDGCVARGRKRAAVHRPLDDNARPNYRHRCPGRPADRRRAERRAHASFSCASLSVRPNAAAMAEWPLSSRPNGPLSAAAVTRPAQPVAVNRARPVPARAPAPGSDRVRRPPAVLRRGVKREATDQ